MQRLKNKKVNKQSGAAMLISIVFFLFISLAIISGLVSPSIREFKVSVDSIRSKQSYFLSESGAEDAFYRLKKAKPIGTSTSITLMGNTAITAITDSGYNQKTITSLGDVSSRQRTSKAIISSGAGVGFNYGIQAGDGGFKIDGSSTITGSVYANGNIDAKDTIVTGSATAAGAGSTIGRLGSNYYALQVGQNGVGDVWASNVVSTSAVGHMYCLTQGSYVNKVCDTSKGIPPAIPMPFTDQNITDWKTAAAVGNPITGNYTVGWAGATLGPKKITGNLVINGGGTLTLTGTLWVVGNVTVTGGGRIKLPTNYALNSETIVSDGLVSINGGGSLGSGTPGSYLFIVSTSTSASAIRVTGGAGAIAVDAQNGTVALSGGATLNSAVGKTVTVTGGTTVNYQQGLASPSFINGPSGTWNLSSWKEI
ncbi:MAG: hypothetical protein NT161_00050 [Candidatus Nomurabacteria bacterium]|nr:hypothetical protein [Candidatus Nomurabacteria bacterium]